MFVNTHRYVHAGNHMTDEIRSDDDAVTSDPLTNSIWTVLTSSCMVMTQQKSNNMGVTKDSFNNNIITVNHFYSSTAEGAHMRQ